MICRKGCRRFERGNKSWKETALQAAGFYVRASSLGRRLRWVNALFFCRWKLVSLKRHGQVLMAIIFCCTGWGGFFFLGFGGGGVGPPPWKGFLAESMLIISWPLRYVADSVVLTYAGMSCVKVGRMGKGSLQRDLRLRSESMCWSLPKLSWWYYQWYWFNEKSKIPDPSVLVKVYKSKWASDDNLLRALCSRRFRADLHQFIMELDFWIRSSGAVRFHSVAGKWICSAVYGGVRIVRFCPIKVNWVLYIPWGVALPYEPGALTRQDSLTGDCLIVLRNLGLEDRVTRVA